MKAVVFGGSGFLGTWLVKKLVENNIKTIIFDKNKTSLKNFVDLNDTNIQFIEGDITDFNACKRSLKNIDFVLHQAALGSVPRSIKDPINTNKSNI